MTIHLRAIIMLLLGKVHVLRSDVWIYEVLMVVTTKKYCSEMWRRVVW